MDRLGGDGMVWLRELLDITVFYVECPRCGKEIFGTSRSEIEKLLVEHLNRGCRK